MKTYEINIKRDLFSQTAMLEVSFAKIGRTGKPAFYSTFIESGVESEIERHIRKFEKQHIDTIVTAFWNNKKQRYANAWSRVGGSQQIMQLQSKLEHLAAIINAWSLHPYFEYLNRFILPKMEEIQVRNTTNQFFDYENDLMNYLKAVCDSRLKKQVL